MRGIGRMGRMGTATIALNLDGTPATNPDGSLVQVNAVPANAGGGTTQGRGLNFIYQTPNVASLASGASSTVTIQFDQNSTFTWLKTVVSCDISEAVETPSTFVEPLCTLQITDTGNGMSFMNAPIPVYAMAGSAQLPFILPTPQFVQPNASYQFAWSNYSASTTYTNLRLELIGFRVFNVGTQ